jgi:hypothetical protein
VVLQTNYNLQSLAIPAAEAQLRLPTTLACIRTCAAGRQRGRGEPDFGCCRANAMVWANEVRAEAMFARFG